MSGRGDLLAFTSLRGEVAGRYDADIPEFNAAIERYPGAAVVFEYEAPAEVSRAKASARLDAVVRATAKVFELSPEAVVVKRRRRQRGRRGVTGGVSATKPVP